MGKSKLLIKEPGILAGIEVAKEVFRRFDPTMKVTVYMEDGTEVKPGDVPMVVEGKVQSLLQTERLMLNIMQRMSGIATMTHKYAERLKGTHTKVLDTRKTTPGLRYLEKYAVRVGGGRNHRYCLSDGVLIKDNHIKAAGGILNAVSKVRKNIPHTIKIEVETENFEMVQDALKAGADIIMLDNMSVDQMAEAVKMIGGKALVEASGDMSEEKVLAVAKTGVDIISVGKITHSVKSMDISMRFL